MVKKARSETGVGGEGDTLREGGRNFTQKENLKQLTIGGKLQPQRDTAISGLKQ